MRANGSSLTNHGHHIRRGNRSLPDLFPHSTGCFCRIIELMDLIMQSALLNPAISPFPCLHARPRESNSNSLLVVHTNPTNPKTPKTPGSGLGAPAHCQQSQSGSWSDLYVTKCQNRRSSRFLPLFFRSCGFLHAEQPTLVTPLPMSVRGPLLGS